MDPRPEVFLSYARTDGETLARRIRERLGREHPDIRLWQDRTEMEGDRGWWRQITEALDVVRVMVLVLTPGAVSSPIVRQEWQYARQRGVRIYPVRGQPAPQPDFAAMPRWMSKVHCYDLDIEWDKFVLHLKGPGHEARVSFLAPDLPAGFVQRPREFDQLRALLLHGDRGDPVAITTSLIGAGGFGKTTLAAALCHDDDVITAFDDGILWVTLGENPNVLDGLSKLAAALEGQDPGFRDIEQAAQVLAALLEGKSCLIVVDDVWEPAHLRPFLRGGKTCARLITTRQIPIAVGADCKRVTVDEMTADESVRMLTVKLDDRPADVQQFHALARRLGEWPLMLELIGSALRMQVARGDTVAEALDHVNCGLDKKGVTAFSRTKPQARHESIAATIGVSFELLESPEQRRYLELAIFAEDADISLGALQALWGIDAFGTEELTGRLGDLSLLKYDPRSGTVRLHDVVRKYLAERLATPAVVNARLVEAWGDPHRLPDAFAWRWYTFHLLEAGRKERLRELLLDFLWLQAKLEATDANALLADFDHLPDDAELHLVQGAIRLSAHVLARDKAQLRSQLHGRLLPCDTPAIQHLRAQAVVADGGPWLRPLASSLMPVGGALLRTLEGHGAGVAVAMMPDGCRALIASPGGKLSLWDLGSGLELRTFFRHDREVKAVAVTPDGRRALSGSEDGTLKLWDLDSGQAMRTLQGRSGVNAVAVTPDGCRALSASLDGTLTLWDLNSGQTLSTLRGHIGGVYAVAVTPDGRRALSAAWDKTLRLWDLDSGQALRTFWGHIEEVNAVAVTPDGRRALSASNDWTLKLWDLDSGQVLRTLEGHRGWVKAVAVTPDGRRALSASYDLTLKLWDLDSAQVMLTLEGHSGFVYAVAVTPDGHRALSSSTDKSLKLWNSDCGQTIRTLEGHSGKVRAVMVTPDGSRAISASEDTTLKVWDLRSGEVLSTLDGHRGWVNAVAVTPNGRRAISASQDGTLRLWELGSGQLLQLLWRHQNGVHTVAVAPDGRTAISACYGGELILWDLDSGQAMRTLENHSRTFLTVMPDGRRALGTPNSKTLILWDLSSGQAQHTMHRWGGSVAALAVTPDGRRAISASSEGTLELWDLGNGQALYTRVCHRGEVHALAVTPDGHRALSASDDHTLKLWDLDSGTLLATFHGDAAFWSCAVAPDGVTILGGDAAGRVHFLRLEGM